MPAGDGTGPDRKGSKTGRGLGYCAGYSSPGFIKNPGCGLSRGFGRRFSRNRGNRRRNYND